MNTANSTNQSEPEILKNAPAHVLRRYARNKKIMEAWGKGGKVASLAKRFGIKRKKLYNLRWSFLRLGPVALVDKRSFQAWRPARARTLPKEFCGYVIALSKESGLSRPAALRRLNAQFNRWKSGDPLAAIPGYSSPPPGNTPAGWSPRNLVRFLPARPCAEVLLRLRADGTTKIISGKFSAIPLHPLSGVIDAHILSKGK